MSSESEIAAPAQAHWAVYGSRTGNRDYVLLARPAEDLTPQEARAFSELSDRSFTTQFETFWQFYPLSDTRFVLTRTSWIPGGGRGADFLVWALILPLEYLLSEDCSLVSTLSLFPEPYKPSQGELMPPVLLPKCASTPVGGMDSASLLGAWADAATQGTKLRIDLRELATEGALHGHSIECIFSALADILPIRDRVLLSFSTLERDQAFPFFLVPDSEALPMRLPTPWAAESAKIWLFLTNRNSVYRRSRRFSLTFKEVEAIVALATSHGKVNGFSLFCDDLAEMQNLLSQSLLTHLHQAIESIVVTYGSKFSRVDLAEGLAKLEAVQFFGPEKNATIFSKIWVKYGLIDIMDEHLLRKHADHLVTVLADLTLASIRQLSATRIGILYSNSVSILENYAIAEGATKPLPSDNIRLLSVLFRLVVEGERADTSADVISRGALLLTRLGFAGAILVPLTRADRWDQVFEGACTISALEPLIRISREVRKAGAEVMWSFERASKQRGSCAVRIGSLVERNRISQMLPFSGTPELDGYFFLATLFCKVLESHNGAPAKSY